MATLWNQDEHAQFAVSLGYLTQDQANEWLEKRDSTVGADKDLAPLLLEEGAITEAQYNTMASLIGLPPEAAAEGSKDYQLYLECKQAARNGDIAKCEELMAQIQDKDYRYRAEIQAMKAQNARGQLDKLDEEG